MNSTRIDLRPTALAVDLEGYLIQMEESREWFDRRVLPLSLDQLRWRPHAGNWSIAECLDHLNATLALYLPQIDEAMARNCPPAAAQPQALLLDWAESQAIRAVEPPVTVRAVAPRVVAPSPPIDFDRLVAQFHHLRNRYSTAVRRSPGLDLPRIPFPELIHPLVRSLGGAMAFLAAHDRRHIWQAMRVKTCPAFPHDLAAAVAPVHSEDSSPGDSRNRGAAVADWSGACDSE